MRARRTARRVRSARRPLVDRLEPRMLLAGNVDPTFGVQVTTDFGLRGDVAMDVAQQADGKLVVVGYSRGVERFDSDLAVARYNTDGSLDSAFGAGASTTIGGVKVTGGGGRVIVSLNDPVEVDRGEAGHHVKLHGDKIVVSATMDGMMTLVRFNANGSLDTTFDGDGVAAVQDQSFTRGDGTPITVHEDRTDLAVVSDGYLLSGTQTHYTPDSAIFTDDQNWVLAKYDHSGQPVTTFGAGGRTVTDFQGAGFTDSNGDPVIDPRTGTARSWDETHRIDVQPDGKIIQSGGNEILRRTGQFRNSISFVRFNADGTPDTSFGGTRYFRAYDLSVTSGPGQAGRAIIEFQQKPRDPGEPDTLWTKPFLTITGLTSGPGGSILATGPELNRTFRLADNKNTSRILVYRLAPNGTLDTGFAGDGMFEGLPVAGRVNQQDDSTAILYRPEIDKILVVGRSGTGAFVGAPGNFLLLQLNSDGTPDTSFGPDGAKKFTAGATMGRFNAALFQPADGKLVAVGQSGQGVNRGLVPDLGVEPIDSDFVVGRFNADGSLDTTFGRDNSVVPEMTVLATAVQADGTILTAGYRGSLTDGTARATLARYTADGAPDPSFAPNPDDELSTVGTVNNAFANDTDMSVIHAVATGADGSVYVAGVVGSQLAVARYTPGGVPDTTFDGDGIRIIDAGAAGGTDAGYGIAVLPNGDAIVAGESDGDWLLVKLRADGSFDTTFDGDGIVIHNRGSAEDAAVSPILVADGKVLVSGTSRSATAAERVITLVRFSADGSVDNSFADGGLVTGLTTAQLGVDDDPFNRLDARSVGIDGSGKLVVAGASGNNAGVARYHGNGAVDTTFGNGGSAVFDWGGTDDPDSIVFGENGQLFLTGTVDAADASNTGAVVAAVSPDGNRRTSFGTEGVLRLDSEAAEGLGRGFRRGGVVRSTVGSRQGGNVLVSARKEQGARGRSTIRRISAVGAALPTDPSGPNFTFGFTRPFTGSFVGGSKGRPVAAAITNPGTNTSRPMNVVLYLSAGPEFDDADRPFATGVVRKALRTGRRAVVKFNRFNFPTDLPAGTYHVLARVDDGNTNVESVETDNVFDGGTIGLAPAFTDAVPLSVAAARVRRGRGTATLLVRNDGNTQIRGPITGTVYASADGAIDGTDTIIGTYRAKASIKPGVTKRVRVRFTPLAGFTGTFTLIFTADAPGDPTPNQSAAVGGVVLT